MSILIILSVICFICFSNLIFIIILSNFVFRFFVLFNKEFENKKINSNSKESNLVDVKNSLTYDPRFRQ